MKRRRRKESGTLAPELELRYARDRKGEPTVAPGIRTEFLGVRDGLKVYAVDGLHVRNQLCQEFTCGGTGARYSWIPYDEVWIDDCLGEMDREATILHEMIERKAMLRGASYDEGHAKANEVEQAWRKRHGRAA